MRLYSLLLSGPIEDAFVYRTSLYCWTYDRQLRVYRVVDLEASARRADDRHADALSYALFHSRGIGASPSQVAAWHEPAAEQEAHATIEIDAEAVPYVQHDVRFEANALLDLLIFYDRLYLASDNGLLSIEPFDPEGSGTTLLPETRVADPCYSAAAGLGAVAASCGPNGLQLLLDDSRSTTAKRSPRKAASESVRAEVGAGTVVNHRSRSKFEFLAGTVEDTPTGRQLTSVRRAKVQRSSMVAEALQRVDKPDFTLWDRARLLVFQHGRILSVSVLTDEVERRLNRTRELGHYDSSSRVISAVRASRTFAIETDDAVILVGDSGVSTAPTGPVVSLRSYPKSHRYQRLVTASSAAGLWLLGIDDKERWKD